MLTNEELEYFTSRGCYLPNLDPNKLMDRRIFIKQARKKPFDPAIMEVKPSFLLHPDTAFMLSPPRFQLPVPQPTAEYLNLAGGRTTHKLKTQQPILLILDLNGTLLHRPKTNNSSNFRRRDRLSEFLSYVFDENSNFKVMIWTTATPANAMHMRNALLNDDQKGKLLATWDRDRCGLEKHMYAQKTRVYKRLEWVWRDEGIQRAHPKYAEGWRWNQTNTILLDDSSFKAAAQPFNHIEVPEFTGPKSDGDVKYGAVLEQVAGYLEECAWQANVSAFVKEQKFEVDEKVGGDPWKGGWFKDLLRDDLDPSGELYPAKGARNFFMMGYSDEMGNWG